MPIPPVFPPATPPGPTCAADQPAVGQPINPGNGNMWHTEHDYSSSASNALSISRTYNSSPYNWDANASYAFGKRWTQPYDSILQAELAPLASAPHGKCYRRLDIDYVWCDPVPPTPTPPTLSTIPAAVSILRGDGKKSMFVKSGTSWNGDADTKDRLSATYNAENTVATSWTYTSADGDVIENYDTNGKLTAITSRAGAKQRLTYSNGVTNDTSTGKVPADAPTCTHVQAGAVLPAGRLLCVTNNFGKQLQFEYDTQGRITKTIDPANQETDYAYDGPSAGCSTFSASNPACSANNLTKVTYHDGKSKTYYYNETSQINAGAACANTVAVGNGSGHLLNTLTSLEDENGARHIRWNYNCKGEATSSELANAAEKVTLAYGTADGTGNRTTTVTHYLGTPANPIPVVRQFNYKALLGKAKSTGIDQPGVGCGNVALRTYDANGNDESTTDWNGNKTTYTYDLTRNLETSRTEAFGTPEARTLTTSWHPTYRLPLQIAEPKRLTTFTHYPNGNLQTKTIQATNDANGSQGLSAPVIGIARKWTYTYNTVGQVLTVVGPRTDVLDKTTYTYDPANGNLATITNAVGQITKLSDYDAHGHVGKIEDPNGATTDLTYYPRGWLKSRTVTAGGIVQATTYDYDGVGQLKKVTFPDASVINYTYDDAHRLTDIADSLGNTIHYTLDNMGNRIKEEVKDTSGALARQTERVYDALNRLQQVTGGAQ